MPLFRGALRRRGRSIGDLLRERGNIRAQAAQQAGEAQSGFVQNLGNTLSGAVQSYELQKPQREAQALMNNMNDYQKAYAQYLKMRNPGGIRF